MRGHLGTNDPSPVDRQHIELPLSVQPDSLRHQVHVLDVLIPGCDQRFSYFGHGQIVAAEP
jgi:hypothetical protein